MLARLKAAWHELREAPPGRRFQQRYERRRSRPRGALQKGVTLAIAVAVIFVGVVALPLPGPGLLIIALGALLIAEESQATARALDRLELWLRRRLLSVRPRRQRRGIL